MEFLRPTSAVYPLPRSPCALFRGLPAFSLSPTVYYRVILTPTTLPMADLDPQKEGQVLASQTRPYAICHLH